MTTTMPETLSAELDALATDGFVILERVLTPGEIAALRAALEPYLQGQHFGRNRFEGLRSQRWYALLAKDPLFGDLVSHPLITALARSPAGAELSAVGGAGDSPRARRGRAGIPPRRWLLSHPSPAPARRRQHHLGHRRFHGRQRRHRADSRQSPVGRRATGSR